MSTMNDPFATPDGVAESTSGPDEVTVETNPETGVTRNANQRYGAAMQALKAMFPDQFQQLLEQEYAKDGVAYKRRRTAEEREAAERETKRAAAQAKIDALRAEFGL